jgi:hypothetical protein
VQTLSVKPDWAARHGLFQDDARKDGFDGCAELFGQPGESEAKSIQRLVRCLGQHRGDSGMGE